MASFPIADQPRGARQQGIQQHADQADEEDGADDVRDGEVVPFVPDEGRLTYRNM